MGIVIEDSDFSLSSSEDEDMMDNMNCEEPNVALHECASRPPIPRRVSFSNRRVSFHRMATCYDVLSLDDYSADEWERSWFTVDDLARMKDIARAEARLLDSGLLTEGRIRGVEQRTKKGMQRKRDSRMGAYAAVFCEIDTQEEEEILDEDSIANAYHVFSKPAAVVAQQTALRDAIEARMIYSKYKKSGKGRVLLNRTLIRKLTSSAA